MKKLIIICIIGLSASWMHAQSLERTVIGSAGLAVQNGTAGLSFTVGEVATNSSNLLTQGFQQPNIVKNTDILDLTKTGQKAIVYPNPTVDMLNIKSNLPAAGINQLSYQVFDLYGKVVLKGNMVSDGGSINVQSLASASYVLVLSNGTEFSQTVRFTRI
jgi:hypothetical protein